MTPICHAEARTTSGTSPSTSTPRQDETFVETSCSMRFDAIAIEGDGRGALVGTMSPSAAEMSRHSQSWGPGPTDAGLPSNDTDRRADPVRVLSTLLLASEGLLAKDAGS